MRPMRLCSALLLIAASALAQPVVTKVEPPSWWTHTALNPVRLMIRGSNLAGAQVTGDLPLSHAATNSNGTYLFIDVQIPADAPAGRHPITIRTGQGTATAPFELSNRLPDAGHFGGLTSDDIVYLIMPDRFANGDSTNDNPPGSPGLFNPTRPRYYHGGDLKGIQDHLPYFKALGVTALWLNPWYDNVNHLNERETPEGKPITDYHGYGAVDFYGVEEHFGTLDSLRALADAAHAAGIKLVQDEVANHTGPYHPWLADPPTPTWFHGTAAHHVTETWQLWPLIDPHSTSTLRAQTLDGWFADILPDLNQDDPECARYLIQNTLWWIGVTGLDAIRMDTLPYVPRTFWKTWMDAIRREFPKVNVIGEVFDADPAIPSAFQSDGLSVFDFPQYFKVREVLARGSGSLQDLAGMLGHDALYVAPDRLGTFIGNHDVIRFMNEEGATVERLKLAFTWLLTSRGVPTIYYGDEIAMRGAADPDNRRDFPVSAFTQSGRTPEQDEVWTHVKTLTHLRQSLPALRLGTTLTLCATKQQWVYSRTAPEQTVYVEMNNAETPARAACPVPATTKTVLGTGAYGDEIPAHSARVSVQNR